MLDDNVIKLIIQGLDEEFDKKKEEHKLVVASIQELCNHTEIESIMLGKRCKVCGKIVQYY